MQCDVIDLLDLVFNGKELYQFIQVLAICQYGIVGK